MFSKTQPQSLKFPWIKVAALLLALVGIFWARSQLMNTAQPKPPAEAEPIPAKVEFGK
ncbi:MAG: hypothetical protein ACAH59_11235 [Pseudobdellovibrionaceae bacterium]